jgi:hypothetical protein
MAPERLMASDDIPAVLTPAELRVQLHYSRTRFFELEKAGAFDALRAEGLGGQRRYSGVRLARILAGDTDEQRPRFLGRARQRRKATRHDTDSTEQRSGI